jgi:hypothetical protein
MPAALLAVLLALTLTASAVDPRLAEPLRLLAEAHDHAGQPIGARYVSRCTIAGPSPLQAAASQLRRCR